MRFKVFNNLFILSRWLILTFFLINYGSILIGINGRSLFCL
nr:MAG TPA: hypothetical protein [Caudoviricetes sp.]